MGTEKSPYCNCLYYSANALSRLMTRMADEEFALAGVSSSYAFLLMTVNGQPGIQPKEISQKMQLTPSTVTRLVEKMEARGLLERKSSGRATEVYPTEKSQELQPRIQEAWQNLYRRYANILGEKASQALTSAIYEASRLLE
ncbi:MAG: winged helix-turn-helix transcriptional regulator [Saprospiraceae bacterium]|nr:winged helix-turn-helix transcriptional regulator [Saprospiraceae bacterium]